MSDAADRQALHQQREHQFLAEQTRWSARSRAFSIARLIVFLALVALGGMILLEADGIPHPGGDLGRSQDRFDGHLELGDNHPGVGDCFGVAGDHNRGEELVGAGADDNCVLGVGINGDHRDSGG